MQQEWKIFARNVSEMLDSSLDNMTWRALTYLLMGNLSGKPRQIPLKYSLGFYYRKPHSSEYMYVHVAAMGAFRPGMYSGAELSEWFDCALGLEDIIRLNRLLLEHPPKSHQSKKMIIQSASNITIPSKRAELKDHPCGSNKWIFSFRLSLIWELLEWIT